MRSIAVINQKGGVGKTTSAVNLSAALADAGRRVCVIDLDPQAHASLHFGLSVIDDCSMYEVLCGRATIADAQSQVIDAVKSIDIMDPTSELGRFEEKIRREEAKVLGQQELAASSLDAQFESLEDVGVQAEVDARLAALKQGGSPQAIDQ